MSRNIKKLLSTMLVIIITTALFLTGCGKSKPANGPVDPSQIKEVTINFSEQDDPNAQDPVWDEIIKEFQTKYPTVTIKRTHAETEGQRTDWQNAVVAGAGPELISCPHDNIGLFGVAGTAAELDGFMSDDFWKTIDKDALDQFKFNGKIYGIPYKIGNTLTLVYNKKYIQEPPKTMDELIAKGKELTNGTEFYGLVYDMVEPFFVLPYLGGYGGKVFDEKGNPTLNTDAMKKMVQLIYDLKYTHKIVPKEGNTDVANALFNEGKAAMIINGPWFYSQAKTANIDIGIANIPQVPGGTWPAPYTGAKVLMVNPNIKDENTKLAVRTFIEFLNTKEIQLKLAKMSSEVPTNVEALKDPYVTADPWVKAVADQMKVGVPMPYNPEMRAIWDSTKEILNKVMGGEVKPEDAPKMMQELCEQMIKDKFGK